MKTGASLKNRQGGAVAVMVGISMVVLIGFLAMVIDLGRLYVARAGLQNAADAAALSGAKQLDGTGAHICCGAGSAAYMAIHTAGLNTFFGSGGQEMVEINTDNVWVSSDGTTNWVPANTAKNQAKNNYFFIKVDTASGNLTTWFAPIWNIFTTRTYGSAVAGPLMADIMPLGVCAIDPTNSNNKWAQYGTAADDYELEYGFAYGVSYDIGKVNDANGGVSSGAPLYLHPTAQTHDECVPQQNNANFPVPFMCTGQSALSGSVYVYANTGWGGPDIYDAINTRFTFAPSLNNAGLDASMCPPDANIKEYTPDVAAGWMNSTQPPIEQAAIYRLGDWLNASGIRDTAVLAQIKSDKEDKNNPTGGCKETAGGGVADCTDNYGVLWSYARPTNQLGTLIPSVDWNKGNPASSVYPEGPTAHDYPSTGYDPLGVNLSASPYAEGLATKSDPYYQAGSGGLVGRRVLNLVIVDCTNVTKLPKCDEARVLGVGRFFMQTKADWSGKSVVGEFAGLVPESALKREIRLFP